IYLVEPRRVSTAVLKFSGTLGVRNGIDKRTATISAFSHFVVGSTACNYMFADIQGSTGRDANDPAKNILTLFDPMTHTPDGKSGLGDHGRQGFENFLENHQCNTICMALDLPSISDMRDTLD
ncbi:kinase-like protein, partial [Athelia psychrophila]